MLCRTALAAVGQGVDVWGEVGMEARWPAKTFEFWNIRVEVWSDLGSRVR